MLIQETIPESQKVIACRLVRAAYQKLDRGEDISCELVALLAEIEKNITLTALQQAAGRMVTGRKQFLDEEELKVLALEAVHTKISSREIETEEKDNPISYLTTAIRYAIKEALIRQQPHRLVKRVPSVRINDAQPADLDLDEIVDRNLPVSEKHWKSLQAVVEHIAEVILKRSQVKRNSGINEIVLARDLLKAIDGMGLDVPDRLRELAEKEIANDCSKNNKVRRHNARQNLLDKGGIERLIAVLEGGEITDIERYLSGLTSNSGISR